jgi:hypothetical protein
VHLASSPIGGQLTGRRYGETGSNEEELLMGFSQTITIGFTLATAVARQWSPVSLHALASVAAVVAVPGVYIAFAGEVAPIDMAEMLSEDTLAVEVIRDWHVVDGPCPTRQKHITICVGELWPGQDYRIPVRMIVPVDRKAKGFHLTGGHSLKDMERDVRPRGVDEELLIGGIGLVHTIVQEPRTFGEAGLGDEMRGRFIKTLNPRYSIQYWGWPATLIRAVTAAYTETDHFEEGKIAVTGGSKNGASPSVAIICDKRMTALHATVSPIWESPLRLCDKTAWKALDAYNEIYTQKHGDRINHPFLGGTFGPIYNRQVLEAGHSWDDLAKLASSQADHIFISRNLEQLNARNVDLCFHPGTHDFVAFDVPWGGEHYPQIPVYLRANAGHGSATHPHSEPDEANKAAFLLRHFFDGVGTMLEPPTSSCHIEDNRLTVTVTFKPSSGEDSGRIWWMYDRGPDGSKAYLRDKFPDYQWKDMTRDGDAWIATIELKDGVSHIDFYCNHGKTLEYQGRQYRTYLSSPYTRIAIE